MTGFEIGVTSSCHRLALFLLPDGVAPSCWTYPDNIISGRSGVWPAMLVIERAKGRCL
jgi:hypothetical protein